LLAPGISEATCTGPASADVPNSRDGCWAQATWPHSLLFLADLEPGVAEQLVAAGVLHPRAFDAQQSQGLRVMHYDIQAAKLPLGPLPLRGSISGDVYMRQVPVRSPRPGDVFCCTLLAVKSCLPSLYLLFALSISPSTSADTQTSLSACPLGAGVGCLSLGFEQIPNEFPEEWTGRMCLWAAVGHMQEHCLSGLYCHASDISGCVG
jgi:hypothetical protein